MSPKNTTIDQVLDVVQSHGDQIRGLLEAVQATQAQGLQTEKRLTAVVDVVQSQGQQIGEVLEAVHLLSEQMENRFGLLEGRVGNVEAQMVTKTYLDDKLADLRGDLTLLTRKEDDKLLALVDLLYGKRLMTKVERKHIMALQPFAVT
ncbi:MAG: hypothetical protein AAB445_00255 [Patescibacteria group bacterium]